MQISRNISLQPYNTFGIEALAENFAVIETIEDIATISKLTKQYQQWHLLGCTASCNANVTDVDMED